VIDVRVQAGDFDPGHQLERLRALGRPAIASLLVTAEAGDDVTAVVVEHYANMAKAELARIAAEAAERWPLEGVILIHRHGRFAPGDRLLFVGVAARARGAAFASVEFLAAATRARAPFWRKDLLAGGGGRWTGPRG
jgi:molybdopterin synthase catalytic subunit